MSKLEELKSNAGVRGISPDGLVTVSSVQLAHLFDPVLAVHTSLVDPLPHQISAVFESMLPRQPLRFLVADNRGDGKTFHREPDLGACSVNYFVKDLLAKGQPPR